MSTLTKHLIAFANAAIAAGHNVHVPGLGTGIEHHYFFITADDEPGCLRISKPIHKVVSDSISIEICLQPGSHNDPTFEVESAFTGDVQEFLDLVKRNLAVLEVPIAPIGLKAFHAPVHPTAFALTKPWLATQPLTTTSSRIH